MSLVAVFSPPGDAGEVVGGIPAQSGVVDVLVGTDAVTLADVFLIGDHDVGDPPSGVEDFQMIVDQLKGVAVAGDQVADFHSALAAWSAIEAMRSSAS